MAEGSTMRRIARAALLAVACVFGVPETKIPPFALEVPTIKSGPPRFAFNGRDLSGFSTYTRYHGPKDPQGVFSVEDGLIRVTGREFGGLTTRDSFDNYHLVVEWKWGLRTWTPRRHRARNSGVMVHCVGAEGDAFASWMASIECQIIEGGTGDFIVVPGKEHVPSLTSEVRVADGQSYYQKGGEAKTKPGGRFNWWGRDPAWRDVAWFRGPLDVEKPVGEWNRVDIVCRGDSITYLLNGVVMNVGTGAKWSAGRILLQSEGAEIFFRKFEVRPLVE